MKALCMIRVEPGQVDKVLKILKRKGEWYMVQTPDDYISWIDHGGIKVMSDKNFDNYYLNNYVFSHVYGFSYETINKEKIVTRKYYIKKLSF